MSAEQEGNSRQRTMIFGIVFVVLLIIAVLVGYVFMGNPPASSRPTDTPAPVGLVPPAAPSNLGADMVAVFDIPVGWQDNSNNEDGFYVYRQRLDFLSNKEKAGNSGKDTTAYLDTDAVCGATYQYIVASYNAAGESPTGTCWQITLPSCPAPIALKADAGDKSQPADFYLSADGASFMADQPGQNGLIDLGDLGDTALDKVTLPQPPEFKKDGVPVVAGHTYAVLTGDGESVLVFTVDSVDARTASLTGIVWHPGSTISGACQPLGDVTPGGVCISGDKICDPNCTGGPDRDCSELTETPPPCTPARGQDCVTPTVTETVTETGTPPCEGENCVTPTVPVTETETETSTPCIPGAASNNPDCTPEPTAYCYCEVENGQWNGNEVCTDAGGEQTTTPKSPNCPVPVCGDGKVEGVEACDGSDSACGQGSSCKSDCTCTVPRCTCIPSTAGGPGHCRENPNQTCTP